MAIYTVHGPDDASDHVTRADRTVFVREGFSVWAFVFGLLFLLWHRLWLATALWIAVALVLGAVCWVLHLPSATALLLAALMHLFVGVEGNDLRRWTLEHNGIRCIDLASGATLEEAELAFFHRQPVVARAAQRPAPPTVMAADTTPAVIGMFPEEGA